MTTALNLNQQAILEHAVQHSGGKIAWFPEHIKGGARAKVLEGLFKRALITPDGDTATSKEEAKAKIDAIRERNPFNFSFGGDHAFPESSLFQAPAGPGRHHLSGARMGRRPARPDAPDLARRLAS